MQTQVNKLNFTGQDLYIGLDTHKKNWKVALYHNDLALKTFVQDPEPEKLVYYLRKNYPGATYHCAYEASYCGFWIQKALEKNGINCMVVNPADVPTTDKEKKFKTDKRDCRKIARSLRNGELDAIYIPSDECLEDRNLVRLNKDMVKNNTRYKNKIKSILFFYGINMPEEFKNVNTHWSINFYKWLQDIKLKTETGTSSLQFYVRESLHANILVKETTKKLVELSRTKKYVNKIKLLRSIPGIGLKSALTLLTELEDINRFKTLDKLCAYFGLIPNTNSSGEKERIGEMTNRGNSHLKTIIIESAWMAIRHDPVLLYQYQNCIKRMNSNNAIIRIAKKLLNRVRFVMINEIEYKKNVI